ncbi:Hypothetical predicted protein [Lynx pardinus]|uniref:Uncharacterized protein n=1 Tax=Lynx pardinus TaxID=191816 RepID=A0A485PGS1_LYNPA|nr:Hypothetical predicted protein [Lynx pardinus]
MKTTHQTVTYKITSGDIQVIQRFWIHPLSGMIELTTQPDYETMSTSQPGDVVTIAYTAINTYNSRDRYSPFIFTLMTVFFASLVSWVCFLLWRYGNTVECCHKMAKEGSKPKPKQPLLLTFCAFSKETIVCETAFDGEATDPVFGNLYKYNRTGAREWKKSPRLQESVANIYCFPEAHLFEASTSLKIPMQG